MGLYDHGTWFAAMGGTAGTPAGTPGKRPAAPGDDYSDMLADFFGTPDRLSSETTDEIYSKAFAEEAANGETESPAQEVSSA